LRGDPGEPQVAQRLRPVESPIRFGSASAAFRYTDEGRTVDLTPYVCTAKRSLNDAHVSAAVVMGRHDHRPLTKTARAQFSSNEGLAQSRAEEVARYLRATNDCGAGIESVITFIAGPRNVGSAARTAAIMAEDRTVEIWGFGDEKAVGTVK
jgi:hypothetical protein